MHLYSLLYTAAPTVTLTLCHSVTHKITTAWIFSVLFGFYSLHPRKRKGNYGEKKL